MTNKLKYLFLCGVIITLLSGRVFATVSIPTTPAGVALDARLTSFNSRDARLLQAFYDSFSFNGRIEEDQKMQSRIGELVLLRITVDEKLRIEALLKGSKDGTRYRIRVVMIEKNPSAIYRLYILQGTTMPFPE